MLNIRKIQQHTEIWLNNDATYIRFTKHDNGNDIVVIHDYCDLRKDKKEIRNLIKFFKIDVDNINKLHCWDLKNTIYKNKQLILDYINKQ